MTRSELVQSTMTPEVSKTYYALRRMAHNPFRDPDEFVERVLQAVRHRPEQLEEVAGRWHRRVVKMRREEQVRAAEQMWLQEKGGRTEVWIEQATSNHTSLDGESVDIQTYDPYAAAGMVEARGGTHYPEHSCWLLAKGVDIDLWVPHVRDLLAKMPEPTYSVVSGGFDFADEVRASGLSLSEALTTASRLFASHQEQRVKEGLPRLQGQFTSLDNCDSVYDLYGRIDEWYWLCDEREKVRRGDDVWLGETVGIVRDDPSEAVA